MAELPIHIRASNYDGTPHWSHAATLLQQSDALWVTRTESGLEVLTERGVWNSPFDTRGHYWPDRWYNVIRLAQNGGRLQGFYCNIASPATFDGESLRYVDLQLDVRVFVSGGDWSFTVLDADEFEAARRRYAYPDDLVVRCRRAVDECIALIEARAFPFDT
jgi:protein associated with RNAse G/E